MTFLRHTASGPRVADCLTSHWCIANARMGARQTDTGAMGLLRCFREGSPDTVAFLCLCLYSRWFPSLRDGGMRDSVWVS